MPLCHSSKVNASPAVFPRPCAADTLRPLATVYITEPGVDADKIVRVLYNYSRKTIGTGVNVDYGTAIYGLYRYVSRGCDFKP